MIGHSGTKSKLTTLKDIEWSEISDDVAMIAFSEHTSLQLVVYGTHAVQLITNLRPSQRNPARRILDCQAGKESC